MGKWWYFGPSPRGEHNAMVDDAGGWVPAMVGFRSLKYLPSDPTAQPPLWWRSNAPVSGNWMRVPLGFVQQGNDKTRVILRQRQIGPTDSSSVQAKALQAALANSLRKAGG